MNDPFALAGKRVAIFGLGDTGLSMARYAAARGAQIRVLDTRTNPPHAAQLAKEIPAAQFVAGSYAANAIADCDLIFRSPGVAKGEPVLRSAHDKHIPIVGDVEIFARHIPEHVAVIAITGANGKTTTTSLVGALCKAGGLDTLVAGNIGTHVLDALRDIEVADHWPDVVVLELSSFQLETTMSLRCRSAVVLNISEDHLDRYESYFDYAATKSSIYAHAKMQVINRDDVFVAAMRLFASPVATFGIGAPPAGDWGIAGGHLMYGSEVLLPAAQIRLLGQHNHLNVLAALALVEPLAIDRAIALDTIRNFEGLPHRMTTVATVDRVAYIDDSKGTNVGAVVAALGGLGKQAVLIAGGDGKGQDFSPLRPAVASHARGVALIGRDAPRIAAALAGLDIPITYYASLPAAVRGAAEIARPGDAVLLSPGCASFDMFDNYTHRSKVFVDAVAELAHA